MNRKNPKIAVTEPEIQPEITAFASFVPVIAAAVVVRQHVSRKPSNSRGRKGTVESPRGIQASDRREVRNAILHHELGRKGCASLSLRRMAADRGEAGAAFEFQPDQEEVFESHELLRPGGRDRRAGKAAGSLVAQGIGGDQG